MLPRLLGAIDRINRSHPWSHNDAYSGFVIRQAMLAQQAGGDSALDVGCGTGNLLLRLGRVFPHVTGLEMNSETATRAAARTSRLTTVTVSHASFPSDSARYDFVSMVAVLHHLPLVEGTQAARDAVAPGGRLVIVGVCRDEPSTSALEVLSLILNPIVGLIRHPRRATTLPENMTAPIEAAQNTYEEIENALRCSMPGIKVRRRLFWRYTAVWCAAR